MSNKEMNHNLEPCPFCGEMPVIEGKDIHNEYNVSCINNNCDINPWSRDKNKEQAIEAWNRRHNDAVFEFEGEAKGSAYMGIRVSTPPGAESCMHLSENRVSNDYRYKLTPGKKYKVTITEI